MRLMLFSHSSELRGAERSLADMVAGLSRGGVERHVILPDEGPLRAILEKAGARVISCRSPRVSARWSWARHPLPSDGVAEEFFSSVSPEIDALRPDAIFTQTIVCPWGAIHAESRGLPHLLAAREYGRLDHGMEFPLGHDKCVQALHDTSEHVFCVSEDVRRTLFPDSNRASVNYSGIRRPAEAPPARARGSATEPLEIGLFAVFHPGKGQADLVRACAKLIRSGVPARCHLRGPQPDEGHVEEVRRLIASLGMETHVLIEPQTSDVCAEMAKMDVVACCSTREAMGRTLIEASLLGVPVVFADSGGAPEVFAHGKEGLCYAPGNADALAEALRDVALRPDAAAERAQRAGARCRELFSPERYSGAVRERLLSLPAKRSAGRGEPVWNLLASRFEPVEAQLFATSGDAFSEAESLRLTFHPGRRATLRFAALERLVPPAGRARLRLDPANRPALIRLHRARLVAENGESRDLAAGARIGGGMVAIDSGSDPLAALAWDDDPSLILPDVTAARTGSWAVEIEMTVSDGMPLAARLLAQTRAPGPLRRFFRRLARRIGLRR